MSGWVSMKLWELNRTYWICSKSSFIYYIYLCLCAVFTETPPLWAFIFIWELWEMCRLGWKNTADTWNNCKPESWNVGTVKESPTVGAQHLKNRIRVIWVHETNRLLYVCTLSLKCLSLHNFYQHFDLCWFVCVTKTETNSRNSSFSLLQIKKTSV